MLPFASRPGHHSIIIQTRILRVPRLHSSCRPPQHHPAPATIFTHLSRSSRSS
ncbi:hypothetical protein C8R44DRAFT_821059 [Mycena epipterygia]|nr:hypothetical protein C8R44DRAFT_821059 [Mycena epipterygia]